MTLLLAPLLASRTLNAPQLTTELRLASGMLVLNALNGTQTGALAGFEGFKALARINIIRGALTFPITIVCVVLWQLPGAVCSLVAATAAGCVLNNIAIRRQCRANAVTVSWRGAWSERRILWSFSTPTFLSGVMAGPISWIANTLLVHQPNGYAEMGLFSAATQWRTAIAFLPSVLGQLAPPILANLYGQEGLSRYKKALILNLALNTAGAACVAVPFCFAAPYIMHMYGPAFENGSIVLVLLAVVSILVASNNVVGSAIVSSGAAWLGFLFNTLWAIALLAGAWLLIPRYGSAGLAWAFLIAYIAHSIWQSVYFSRRLTARSHTATLQPLCGTEPPQPDQRCETPAMRNAAPKISAAD